MGDVIQLRDYNPKIKEAPVQLEDGLSIIAQAMDSANYTREMLANDLASGIDGLPWPGMDALCVPAAVYEPHRIENIFVALEKDPA